MNTSLRKTKIVATIGPASADEKTITAMVKAGMNVARVNFSHGSHEEHRLLIERVRAVADKLKTPVAILQDLGGPKIRIGDFIEDKVVLKSGARFTLTTKKVGGTNEVVSVNYKKLPHEVEKGTCILLDDGKVHLVVEKVSGGDIVTKVKNGGTIKGRRGVNLPDASLSISALTAKDKKDLLFGKEMKVDFVTLSFVRHAKEIAHLRAVMGDQTKETGIIAKIETAEAVANIDAIIEAADAIMIARGDLAVEIPKEHVPLVQKSVILKCNRSGVPVITATQMLDSMKVQVSPTRAEVNDVANAIFDGTDALMLSDETAIGTDPAHVVETMAKIAYSIETSDLYREALDMRRHMPRGPTDAVTTAIVASAKAAGAAAIVAFSESGYTGRLVARHRPEQPILVLTPHKKTFYQSLLNFGCYPHNASYVDDVEAAIRFAAQALVQRKLAKKGDLFVLGAGLPLGKSGPTNTMIIGTV